MKAAVMLKANQLVVQEVKDLPAISDYQCLCRNLFASACTGTDRKLLKDHIPWGSVSYPAVLGHETVGEVVAVGAKVKNFKAGDIVLRPVYGYAGQQVNGLGNEFGGFSECGIITDCKAMLADGLGSKDFHGYANYQMKIPASWKNNPESVIFITMKETFSWIRQLAPLYGKKVGIIGAGTVGMFYARFASLMFASEVTVIARSAHGAERAKQCGADKFIALDKDEKPEGQFDLLIDAAGVMTDINKFLPWVKPGGTYAVYGLGERMDANIQGFGSGVIFSFHSPAETDQLVHDICVSLVGKGIIDLKQFHSTVFPFEKMPEAFELIERKEEFKPVFKF
ncbi:MAG: alcohol dehydrogenase catalytic domain-containing protein [Victivallaceae bacterium]